MIDTDKSAETLVAGSRNKERNQGEFSPKVRETVTTAGQNEFLYSCQSFIYTSTGRNQYAVKYHVILENIVYKHPAV